MISYSLRPFATKTLLINARQSPYIDLAISLRFKSFLIKIASDKPCKAKQQCAQ